LWKKLVLHSERVAVVWSAVSEVIHRAPLGRVCLAGAAIEHDNDRYLSEQLAQSCLEQVHREAIEKALKGDDLNQIIIDLHRRSVTFAPHAIHGASKAFELDQLLQDLSRAFDQGDLNLFQSSLSSLVVRGEALGMASDATPLQYAFISRLVAQGAYMRALRQIVSLPFEERKPETHANLLKALAGLQIADVSVLEDSQIRAALLRYAAKDEEIYAEWLRIHYQLIEDLLRAGARDSARHIANRLREENPSIALPIALKLKLALGWGSIWCFLLLLFGVCLFATRFRWFKKQSRVPDALSETKVCSDDSEPERAPHSEEYTNLLRVFGLEPGVDLSEIKNAYRSAVKQIHPDLQGADSIRDTGSFVKLTSDYRRLLELHEHD
jgi:DnaJ-domain-containing protein 1